MTARKIGVGLRGGGAALLGAVAAMTFGVGSAGAATIELAFDHGLMKLGGSGDPIDIIGDGNQRADAEVCTDTIPPCDAAGDFTVPFDVQELTFDLPPFGEATVDLGPEGGADVTGKYDFATGRLVTDRLNYTSTFDLAGASCVIRPIPMAFSTERSTPFLGDAFDPQGLPLTTPVNGVMVADWPTLPTPADNPNDAEDDSATCALLKALTDGPGGIGLGNGIAPVLAPTPSGGGGTTTQSLSSTPVSTPVTSALTKKKKKRCKKKHKRSAGVAKKKKCKKRKGKK